MQTFIKFCSNLAKFLQSIYFLNKNKLTTQKCDTYYLVFLHIKYLIFCRPLKCLYSINICQNG